VRIFPTLGVALLIPFLALAQNNDAEQADRGQVRPDQVASDPYSDLNKQVQEKLRAQGFYAGPVNGDFGFYTQAALAQFQLSVPLPASGMLDDQTLAALGVELPAPASSGASDARSSTQGDATDRRLGGSCDALVGPDKENCLKQGGTVEASAPASNGSTVPATSKEN
jgi:peptidoglycan hydrolase-like protein with peptidoglycan-binding domain